MKLYKPVVDLYRGTGVSGGVISSLVSTTVDNIYDDWDVLTSYTTGDYVVYGFLYYVALQDSTGENPETATSYWTAIGYSNRYSMFSGATTTSTIQSGDDFIVEISGENVNAISFFRLSASSVNITMTHPTLGEVYNREFDVRLNTLGINDYYDYFFLPYPDIEDETDTLTVLDIPPYPTATIEITITAPEGEDAYLGLLTYGTIREFGTVDYGTSFSINDYSTKETNSYGDTTIVERPYTDQLDFDITIYSTQTSFVKSLLSAYRATPITIIGNDDDTATHIYGFIDDFEVTYSDYSTSDMTLTIEGL